MRLNLDLTSIRQRLFIKKLGRHWSIIIYARFAWRIRQFFIRMKIFCNHVGNAKSMDIIFLGLTE